MAYTGTWSWRRKAMEADYLRWKCADEFFLAGGAHRLRQRNICDKEFQRKHLFGFWHGISILFNNNSTPERTYIYTCILYTAHIQSVKGRPDYWFWPDFRSNSPPREYQMIALPGAGDGNTPTAVHFPGMTGSGKHKLLLTWIWQWEKKMTSEKSELSPSKKRSRPKTGFTSNWARSEQHGEKFLLCLAQMDKCD